MITIEEANITDAKIIALLGRVTFNESHSQYINNKNEVLSFCDASFNISRISKDLEDKNNIFWIIYYDKLPVGYAKVILNKTVDLIKEKKVCQLDKIYILNDFLGKKLGSKLHHKIIEKVTELKFDIIWLVTYILNYKAIQFYELNNYKKAGFIDFVVENKGYKNHVLVKYL